MVIFPNNEVRIEYDNNYDKQMGEYHESNNKTRLYKYTRKKHFNH